MNYAEEGLKAAMELAEFLEDPKTEEPGYADNAIALIERLRAAKRNISSDGFFESVLQLLEESARQGYGPSYGLSRMLRAAAIAQLL